METICSSGCGMGSFGVIFKYIYFATNHSGIDLCKLHVEAAELKSLITLYVYLYCTSL